MEYQFDEETVFGLLLRYRTDRESGFDLSLKIDDFYLSVDGIWEFLEGVFEKRDPDAVGSRLLEIIITLAESAKLHSPELAARVRKINLEHFKSKQKE